MTPIEQNVTPNDYNFEQVDNFIYWDTTITTDNNEMDEINIQIMPEK